MNPIADEMVVVYNPYSDDGSKEMLEDLRKELDLRVVSGVFDLRNIGWISYGIMRTTGYLACKGDLVLMFDADGVLHEKQLKLLAQECVDMLRNPDVYYGFWTKNRVYSPTKYWHQNKHSGWYKKKVLGDNFDFYHPNGKGIPNWTRLPESRGIQFDTTLFGYEHVWDTKELLRERATNYGHMMARQHGWPIRSDDEYYQVYIDSLKDELAKKSLAMKMEDHPAIIRPKLEALTPDNFGYNFFGLI